MLAEFYSSCVCGVTVEAAVTKTIADKPLKAILNF